MQNTTIQPKALDTTVDDARAVLADALVAFADRDGTHPDEAALASAMADNVRGWTHTTRLREFLEAVQR
jgi:hypothetical protein